MRSACRCWLAEIKPRKHHYSSSVSVFKKKDMHRVLGCKYSSAVIVVLTATSKIGNIYACVTLDTFHVIYISLFFHPLL